jgi:uncharacterized damage-inducible protein DinB
MAPGILLDMSHIDDLANGINYDCWANLLWVKCLRAKTDNALDMSILGHILSAQSIWLSRCRGASPTKMPEVEPTEETIQALNAGWLEVIEQLKDDHLICYHRTTGEAMSSLFHEIVLHVINHGTYHRGELRGLCLARGDKDFPETDRILFTMLISKAV